MAAILNYDILHHIFETIAEAPQDSRLNQRAINPLADLLAFAHTSRIYHKVFSENRTLYLRKLFETIRLDEDDLALKIAAKECGLDLATIDNDGMSAVLVQAIRDHTFLHRWPVETYIIKESYLPRWNRIGRLWFYRSMYLYSTWNGRNAMPQTKPLGLAVDAALTYFSIPRFTKKAFEDTHKDVVRSFTSVTGQVPEPIEHALKTFKHFSEPFNWPYPAWQSGGWKMGSRLMGVGMNPEETAVLYEKRRHKLTSRVREMCDARADMRWRIVGSTHRIRVFIEWAEKWSDCPKDVLEEARAVMDYEYLGEDLE
jgi:hypothetical protein